MTVTLSLADLLARGRAVAGHGPWPRALIDESIWDQATQGLVDGRWHLLGLWGEADRLHVALLDRAMTGMGVVTLACPDGEFPSVGYRHAPALRLERTARDLFGLVPKRAPDARPWLDHGCWGLGQPLAARPTAAATDGNYAYLESVGPDLHQIPVGPVHAGIIEPGHFRFTASGETVVRLEERLGYVHKGVEALMAGAEIERAARIAGRVSGDSMVAYSWAFASAVEGALGIEAPPRARYLRALMAEIERIANHLGDFGAVCNDASFAILQAHCAILRELALRAADAAFGHRLMRDRVVPGGVAVDLAEAGRADIQTLVRTLRDRLPALVDLYDNTASLQDRTVSTGVVTSKLAGQYAAGGYVGRASGRNFDARRNLAYAPYPELDLEIPVLAEGDVNARVWIRIREIEQSLSLIEQILARLPEGALRAGLGGFSEPREGLALVEGFRGDILAWLRVAADGRIARCHLRDPSWFQWPLLEAAVEGNIVADFPLCNKSFNCSYSGHDL